MQFDSASNTTTQANFNILMIEDDPVMQQRLQRILSMQSQSTKLNLNSISENNQVTPGVESFPSPPLKTTNYIVSGQILVAQSSAQTLELLQQHVNLNISLALLDLGLPDGHGLDLIPMLREKYPDIIILVITVCATDHILLDCIQAGANGYLLKEREDFELAIAIKHVLNGAMPIDPFMAKALIDLSKQNLSNTTSASFELSNREIEILKLVTNGLSNRDIAEHLHLSRYTIDTHIRNIYAKLAVNNRSKAIAAANKFKLF